MLNREQIVNKLKEGVVSLSFEKVDTTQREMTATLDETFIEYQGSGKDKKKSEDVLAVWDMDKNAWRSFRWSKLRFFDGTDLPNGV